MNSADFEVSFDLGLIFSSYNLLQTEKFRQLIREFGCSGGGRAIYVYTISNMSRSVTAG